jgi:hypothetical protein
LLVDIGAQCLALEGGEEFCNGHVE